MIGVYATCEVKADQKVAFEALVAQFIAESRGHQGVVSYDCGEVNGKPNHYCFIERWASQEALDVHLASPFFQTNAPKLTAMLVDGLNINTVALR
ncbi:putative quinol monooxygenase [Pasteurellaceae bacterium LIM206]|nr:putative quinol monooxygenase [Pasteurellaceae bacterium LIM206]